MKNKLILIPFLFLSINLFSQSTAIHPDCKAEKIENFSKCTKEKIHNFIIDWINPSADFFEGFGLLKMSADISVSDQGLINIENIEIASRSEKQRTKLVDAFTAFTYQNLLIPATDTSGNASFEYKTIEFEFINPNTTGSDSLTTAEVFQSEDVDQMPIHPDCQEIDKEHDSEELDKCTDIKFLNALYRRIKYPAAAREKSIKGTVLVTYVRKTNGLMGKITLVNDIGGGCGLEVVRCLNIMKEEKINWIPATKEGVPVNVEIELPVKFRLE